MRGARWSLDRAASYNGCSGKLWPCCLPSSCPTISQGLLRPSLLPQPPSGVVGPGWTGIAPGSASLSWRAFRPCLASCWYECDSLQIYNAFINIVSIVYICTITYSSSPQQIMELLCGGAFRKAAESHQSFPEERVPVVAMPSVQTALLHAMAAGRASLCNLQPTPFVSSFNLPL